MALYICFISFCIFFVQKLQFSCGQDLCPVNEVSVTCVDACNTCESIGRQCLLMCSPGCDCIPGYVRDRFGVCIPKTSCGDDEFDDDYDDESDGESGIEGRRRRKCKKKCAGKRKKNSCKCIGVKTG